MAQQISLQVSWVPGIVRGRPSHGTRAILGETDKFFTLQRCSIYLPGLGWMFQKV